jgi:hypothetical protein
MESVPHLARADKSVCADLPARERYWSMRRRHKLPSLPSMGRVASRPKAGLPGDGLRVTFSAAGRSRPSGIYRWRAPRFGVSTERYVALAGAGMRWTQNKPDALLKQIDCNVLPNDLFGKLFKGTLKLEVTEKFEDDLNFWCVKHMQIMRGVIKLKSK